MSKLIWLVNLRSGGGAGVRVLDALRPFCGGRLSAQELDLANPAAQLEMSQVSDRVIIAGGDGTVSRLLPHLMRLPRAVGVFPLGTGNDLARELGSIGLASRPPSEWIEHFQRASVSNLSIWEVQYASYSGLFCCYLSCGFDALVCAGYDRRRSWARQPAAIDEPLWLRRAEYLKCALRALRSPALSEINVRSDVREMVWRPLRAVIFANIKSYMGIGWSNSSSDAFDDLLESIPVRSILDYFRMLAMRRGFGRGATAVQGSQFSVEGLDPGVSIQADGEPLPVFSGNSLQVRRVGGMKVLVA
ncbi:MAG: hypothetical protein K1X83_11985 [Oligoflexia bacterium]|nr:hypothetical protein [Oligoflexia bacterium]